MRVLITGATAPLGAALVSALLADPEVELVLAVGRERDEPPVAHARLRYRGLDLSHLRAVHDLVWGEARTHGIDRIVHGMQHRDAHAHGAHVHRQNVETTRELVRACTDHPSIRRLVYRSFAEVYHRGHATSRVIEESEPLEFSPASPQWIRDRVEADLEVCSHLGGPLSIAVLRFAEIFAADVGSQLWDYLHGRVCLRPVGFDPMINVLSLADAVAATLAALRSPARGVFNIPGADTLPLSRAIAECQRVHLPVPGARRLLTGGVLDGARAERELGFTPRTHVAWPRPWWQTLAARLGADRGGPDQRA